MDNTDEILFAKFAELDQKVASLREDMNGIEALLERRKRNSCSTLGSSNLESHNETPYDIENLFWTTNKTVPAQNVHLPLPVSHNIDSPPMTYQPCHISCKVFHEYNQLNLEQMSHGIQERFHPGNNLLPPSIRKRQKIGSTPNFSASNSFSSHVSCHPYSYPYGKRHFASRSEQSLVYPTHESTGNCYPLISPNFSYSKVINQNQHNAEETEGDDPPSDPEDNGEEEEGFNGGNVV